MPTHPLHQSDRLPCIVSTHLRRVPRGNKPCILRADVWRYSEFGAHRTRALLEEGASTRQRRETLLGKSTRFPDINTKMRWITIYISSIHLHVSVPLNHIDAIPLNSLYLIIEYPNHRSSSLALLDCTLLLLFLCSILHYTRSSFGYACHRSTRSLRVSQGR